MRNSASRTEHVRLTLALCLALTVSACADHVGRADLLAQIEAGSAPPIVDVRSRGEYEASHVPGAVHVAFYSMLANTDDIPASGDEAEPVVVYCEHGPRAAIARAQIWLATGRAVLFLDGHMTAWKQDGLPVEGAETADGAEASEPGG